MEPIPNALIYSSSPYLLQHAYNPVHWFSWGEEALLKARNENKLLLISIGYSACHWCHVMEHESFEDEEVATVMNKFFVCIKVDREERPDIDHVYMEAVQLMTGKGGWPLNCFALPDQRPVYGGTYFPKEQWRSVLLQLAQLWRDDPEKFKGYAAELTEGIQRMSIVPASGTSELAEADINAMVESWSKQFDERDGGPSRSPKFPLPDTYLFLLKHWFYSKNSSLREHIELTLHKMADGGIYDQIGGGFARYSTDMQWKVPHFEKMLYDNAQLVSLYVAAYRAFADERYKAVAEETIRFVQRELMSEKGGFYSALDADTEGVEGKFYTWTKEEFESVTGENAKIVADFFNVNGRGYWEHEQYILLRYDSEEEVAKRHGISVDELRISVDVSKQALFTAREKRIRPGLDDKIITCWNALMIKACAEASLAFAEKAWLELANVNAEALFKRIDQGCGKIIHSFSEREKALVVPVEGFLDDYAAIIDAWITLYESGFDEPRLEQARRWTEYVFEHFLQEESGMFYYTSYKAESLIARKIDLQDNVIPSANAMMAHNLLRLGRHLAENKYETHARKMVSQMIPLIKQATPWYARWAQVLQMLQQPPVEVVITGPDFHRMNSEFHRSFYPDCIVAGAVHDSPLPLLQKRVRSMENLIYVCLNKSCHLPVNTVKEAVLLLKTNSTI